MVVLKFPARKPRDLPTRPPAPALNVVQITRAYLITSVCLCALPLIMLLELLNGNAPYEVPPEERDYD